MKNSPHPGRIVLQECIEPLGLSITKAAEGLGVTRNTLSRLVHGHHRVSPEMAVRLAKAFGGNPESWLRLQMNYDLARIGRDMHSIRVKRLDPA
jgi:addiction module HigA family antidote